jgi:hypothetical protein
VLPSHGVQLDAFVLPIPGRSLAVVFWDRVRRGRTGAPGSGAAPRSALAVYAPGELSPGELSEVSAALTTSVGDALAGGARPTLAPSLIVLWWFVGVLSAAFVAWHALVLGPAFSWLGLLAVGATLPWRWSTGAFSAARTARAARRVATQLGQTETVPGSDPRARERLMAVWQFARGQRGSAAEQLRGLERYCQEQAWPAAAAVYAERAGGDEAATNRSLRRRLRPELRSRRRLYAACEMRAWPSS